MPENPLIVKKLKQIDNYVAEAKKFRAENLEASCLIKGGNNALVYDGNSNEMTVHVFKNGLWRKKIMCGFPGDIKAAKAEMSGETLQIRYARDQNGLEGDETVRAVRDPEENEAYFRRSIRLVNGAAKPAAVNCKIIMRYLPEAALSEFTYVSYKWMDRYKNLGAFPEPGKGYTGSKANNQLFYNYSGGIYIGAAYLDTQRAWLSDLVREGEKLYQFFELENEIMLEAGKELIFDFVLFAGVGRESHIGHCANVLWRLNRERDPASYVPQTDIRDLRKKIMSTWERTALSEYADHDHFAAHFFSDFFGQFEKGAYTKDQFGCSWISYDILKAKYYFEEYKKTGDNKFRDYARNIIDFYACRHYVGDSKINFPFHTGAFMKKILPFPEETGWGAPFDAGAIDSLATAEMISDLLEMFIIDKTLFKTDYPRDILADVLKLQLEDGHFCRLYDKDLRPKHKAGWVCQFSEGQTWIPVLLKLWRLTGDGRCLQSALKAGRIFRQDVEQGGIFAMGGSENDYPDYYDVDGYRTMLWAFLDLFYATGDRQWADAAEEVQLLGNMMMMGYNPPVKPGTFYSRRNWKPRGMVATSYYSYPDYIRTECTATGNQSVNWLAFFIMQVYDVTSRKIYADRAVACFRQVSLFRDEESLAGSPFSRDLLHTIFENHPQIDDEAGLYEEGMAQNSFSAFMDLMLYECEIMNAFGGISVRAEKEKQHVIGIDCVDAGKSVFEGNSISFVAENILPRRHATTVKAFGLDPSGRYVLAAGNVKKEYSGRELADGKSCEISFGALECLPVAIVRK